MKSTLRWLSILLVPASLVIEESGALAGQAVVFQAVNFPGCQPGLWRAISGGSVTARRLGFSGCTDSSGFRGAGTPNDPYRVALDGQSESIDLDGIEVTTQTDYTVLLWFRVTTNKKGRMLLVDSWKDRFYAPLRMMISDGKPECSIDMPFPDRVYLASSSVPLTMSTWHQGACRFRAQSRELSLFLDGRMDGSTRIPPGTIRSNHIRIGGNLIGNRENFAGDIAAIVFSEKSEEASALAARCREESHRFAGASCRK
jgi:Concanavalin A-like lectin/glucanases superfamily